MMTVSRFEGAAVREGPTVQDARPATERQADETARQRDETLARAWGACPDFVAPDPLPDERDPPPNESPETGESGPAADWRQAARAFLDARGFAPGSPFRAIAEALADGFAASPAPFRLPLALELFGEQGQDLGLAERDGPSGFADVRRAVAAVAVEFPQVTAEHVRVALNVLGQGGLVESAYREIDPATGATADVPAEDVAALLRRAREAGPDAATAGERLARIVLDRWPVAPLKPLRSAGP